MEEDGENVMLSNCVGWFVDAYALLKVISKKYVKNNFVDETIISIAGNKKRQQGVGNWRDMMMFSLKFIFFCGEEKEEKKSCCWIVNACAFVGEEKEESKVEKIIPFI